MRIVTGHLVRACAAAWGMARLLRFVRSDSHGWPSRRALPQRLQHLLGRDRVVAEAHADRIVTALAMAGPMATIGSSPTPLAPNGPPGSGAVSRITVRIGGMSIASGIL